MREPGGERDRTGAEGDVPRTKPRRQLRHQNWTRLKRRVAAGSTRRVRVGVALVSVAALVATLAWRAQQAPPSVGETASPNAPGSALSSETATMASTPTSTTTPTATHTASPSAPIAATTLTPGLTPGPTANPEAKATKDFGCGWDGGLMVPLADGRVLVGGDTCVEIFDPATRTFRATGRPNAVRLTAPATSLRDGRAFVGSAPTSNSDDIWTNSAEIVVSNDELFDPASGRFTPISPVHTRHGSAALQLLDGRVLIVGPQALGAEGLHGDPAFAELFDPNAGTFTAAGPLAYRVTFPALVPLADGKVLVANSGGGNVVTQLYDPATNTFRATRGQIEGGLPCGFPNGMVMFVQNYMASVDAYDPRTETFHRLAPMAMSTPTQYNTCTTLTDGRVLVIGESLEAANEPQTVSTMLAGQIYDPARDTWTDLGLLNLRRRQGDVRVSFGVAPLPNGGALVIADEPGGGTGSTPELFDPKTNKFVVSQ